MKKPEQTVRSSAPCTHPLVFSGVCQQCGGWVGEAKRPKECRHCGSIGCACGAMLRRWVGVSP